MMEAVPIFGAAFHFFEILSIQHKINYLCIGKK